MRLLVQASLAYRFPEPAEVLLLLEVARTATQAVSEESLRITPRGEVTRRDDPLSDERRLIFTATGDVDIVYSAVVELSPTDTDFSAAAEAHVRDLPPEVLEYLGASRYCPSDRFHGFVHQTFGEHSGGRKVAAILRWLADNIEYRRGVSDSASTALDSFVDRAGVCRDFTHLAITFCRAAQIPARAVSAYAWGLTPPDMHAVAEVYLDGRWWLIDPTGKAPVEGLIRVATGRDAMDIAFMTIFGTASVIAQTFAVTRLKPRPALRAADAPAG